MFGINMQELLFVPCLGLAIWIVFKGKKIYETNLKEPAPQYYGQAEQELNDGVVDKGLWAKAFTKAKGNEDLRKAEYIKLRARQLQENQ